MSSPKLVTLSVSGMSCNHCVMHVKKALSNLPGVKVEDVQIGKASVTLDDSVPQQSLAEAIQKAGYKLDSVS